MPSPTLHTFRDLQLAVLRQIDQQDDSSDLLTFVKEAINRSHRTVLTSRTWPFMFWPHEETLTTTAGTRSYALKPGVHRLLTLWDTESRSYVPLVPRREWQNLGVDRSESLTPVGAIYGDWWPVKTQPSSATTLRIVSSSASDGSGETVQLRGLDANGENIGETLTANGTTQVTSSSSYTHILSVTKGGTWAGTMTLSTSGGTELLVLGSTNTGKQYPTLDFIETPDAARSYLWTATRIPMTLVEDTDIPDTPYPFSEIHVYDALLDLTAYNSELSGKHQALWQARREGLYKGLLESVDEAIVGSRPRFVRDVEATAIRRVSLQ